MIHGMSYADQKMVVLCVLLQVYALQTEALLKLLRHQEAYSTYVKMPKFDLDWRTKLFGLSRTAYLLMIGVQIYLAAGRLVKMFYFHIFDKIVLNCLV